MFSVHSPIFFWCLYSGDKNHATNQAVYLSPFQKGTVCFASAFI